VRSLRREFSWRLAAVENMAEIGFPIEKLILSEFIITKHEKLGGKVSFETVAETASLMKSEILFHI